jgi:hypothetical protein
MSNYIKSRADQKRKINKDYREKLFAAASLVLPAVVASMPDDYSPSNAVDDALVYARDLLAALNYKEIGGEDEV